MNKMKNQQIYRFKWILITLMLTLTIAGCAGQVETPAPDNTVVPMPQSASPEETGVAPTAVPDLPANEDASVIEDVLFEDDFTDPNSGWPQERYDNYFIGYHEPDYYHVQVQSPNDKTLVPLPGKPVFDDATIEVKLFTDLDNTSESGDYRYGFVFRRSGNQFYAFTISPPTKKWYVLKSSAGALDTLGEGTNNSIQGMSLETQDTLRLNAEGPNFYFLVNDQLVYQFSDPDFASGEFGFYVQTFDRERIHAHFNSVSIKHVHPYQAETKILYEDDFTDSSSGWTIENYDNYFFGYHEPEYYHVQVQSPNDSTLVPVPGKTNYEDITVEVNVYPDQDNTAAEGDFLYGIAARRSGSQFYAFTISPRTKKWYVFKSSADQVELLGEGTDISIQGKTADSEDKLRVDARDSDFYFHINDHLVYQFSDPDYASGEVSFYVQTLDSPRIHAHFDSVVIRDVQLPQQCDVTATNLNVRSGPGTAFAPVAILSEGDRVEPVGRDPEGEWIRVRLANGSQYGWVVNFQDYLSCNITANDLPVVKP